LCARADLHPLCGQYTAAAVAGSPLCARADRHAVTNPLVVPYQSWKDTKMLAMMGPVRFATSRRCVPGSIAHRIQ
jgi:hypothetical protein